MKSERASTKDHILDIAEKHFALYGFAGTSLRGIIKEANVNVASVAYHYGTKEALFAAVVERFALPVVDAQLVRLRQIRKSAFSSEAVLIAFYEPPIRLVHSVGAKGNILSLFLGRCQTEPEPIFSIVDKNFADCRNEFIAAFKSLNPAASNASLEWQFEFVLSLIVSFLTRNTFVLQRYSNNKKWNPDEVVEMLVSFALNGISGKPKS